MMQAVVTAPAGSSPGQRVQVSTSSGLALVTIPPGVQPGGQFVIWVAPPVVVTTQQPSSRQLVSTGAPYRRSSSDENVACSEQAWCYKCVCCACYLPCCCCCMTKLVSCVHTGEVAIVEKYGKFRRVDTAGEVLLEAPLGSCCPALNERVAKRLSLRVQELPVESTVKTHDNVFVEIGVIVMYRVVEAKAYEAAYHLTDPKSQVGDYVEDVLRSFASSVDLDALFLSTKAISEAVVSTVAPRLADFGFELVATLVSKLNPDSRVRTSMNEINTQKRLKAAAVFNAEGDRSIEIKRAEARAEASYLNGVGLARMRKAIVGGLAESVQGLDFFSDDGKSDSDSTSLLLVTQYMDSLEHIAAQDNATQSLFLPVGVGVLAVMKARLTLFLNSITTPPPQ